MGKEKNIHPVDDIQEPKSFDLNSDPDDDYLIDDDSQEKDDDEENWDDDPVHSFQDQERIEESGQIASFLKSTLMVRCERYNANLTAVGCQRKKEAPPPRVKNSSLSEEESMQNHPCFGCLGPIVINWPVGSPPISLQEIERAPVIVHPYLEDSFSADRSSRIQQENDGTAPLVAEAIPSVSGVEQRSARARRARRQSASKEREIHTPLPKSRTSSSRSSTPRRAPQPKETPSTSKVKGPSTSNRPEKKPQKASSKANPSPKQTKASSTTSSENATQTPKPKTSKAANKKATKAKSSTTQTPKPQKAPEPKKTTTKTQTTKKNDNQIHPNTKSFDEEISQTHGNKNHEDQNQSDEKDGGQGF